MTDALNTRIAELTEEIEALRRAARDRETVISQGYGKMEAMVAQMEGQRNEQRAIATQLDAEKSFIDRVVNTMSEAMIVTDAKGRITRVNRQATHLTEFGEEELLGASIDQIFCEDELELLRSTHNKRVRPKLPVAYQLFSQLRNAELDGSLRTKTGHRIATLFRWSEVRSSAGKKEGLVIVGTDFRELKKTLSSLEAAHQGMKLVLDNVEQGLLTIDLEGRMSPEYAQTLADWFGAPDLERPVWEWLRPNDYVLFRDWFEMCLIELREPMLPVEVLLDQFPRLLKRDGRTYRLGYRLIPAVDAAADDAVDRLLMVVTDVTVELERERADAEQRQLMAIFRMIMKDRPGFDAFVKEAGAMVQSLRTPTLLADELGLKRVLHTLKGSCGVWGLDVVSAACHRVETDIVEGATINARLMRIVGDAWDRAAHSLEELLVEWSTNDISIKPAEYEALISEIKAHASHERIGQLVRQWRYEPCTGYLRRLAQQAEVLGRRLEKPLVVTYDDNSLRLPDLSWSTFWAAASHAVRNAVDHGIEATEARRAAGKDAAGHITLSAEYREGNIVIAVRDDGAGIDWDRLRDKAGRSGMPAETRAHLLDALFADGVSTKDEVSTLSGRGVGLAALRAACQELGGQVHVDSARGQGTCFEFWIPNPDDQGRPTLC